MYGDGGSLWLETADFKMTIHAYYGNSERHVAENLVGANEKGAWLTKSTNFRSKEHASCESSPDAYGMAAQADRNEPIAAGEEFSVTVSIANPLAPPSCTDGDRNGRDDDADSIIDESDEATLGDPLGETPKGCYRAAQWHIDYDEALLSVVSMKKLPEAPSECFLSDDNGSRVLLGCFNIGGATLRYGGSVFQVVMRCKPDTPGGASLLALLGGDETFVGDGAATQPTKRTDARITCAGPSP